MADHSTIRLTYKYRLYPTSAQAERLDFMLWQARRVYNGALAMRIEAYQERGETLSLYSLRDHWCAQRSVSPDTIGQLPSASVDAVIRRLDKSYKNFFRRVKQGAEKPGFPRFKGRDFWRSVEYKSGSGAKFITPPNGERHARLRLMNVGDIRVRYHRALPEDAKPKMFVVTRSARGHWFVSIQLECPPIPFPPPGEEWIGIDVGLHHLLSLSDGTTIENPRWMRSSLRKLRIVQRKLARQQKGSNRRKKTKQQIACLYDTIANQRRYFWHVTTDWLTRRYGVIVIEDLTLDFMLKNRHLSLSAADASIGLFWQLLEEKAQRRGVFIVRVPAAYTSQECSGCGEVAPKKLSERTHTCTNCGLVLDRDVNAAVNILNRGRGSFDSAAAHAEIKAS